MRLGPKGGLALLAACGLGLALVAATGRAADEEASVEAKVSEQAATQAERAEAFSVNYNGMIVSIDPKSGLLRQPTNKEVRRLTQATQRALRGLQPAAVEQKQLANGAVSVRLDASHLDFSVVEIVADGSVESSCVKGPEEAHAALTGSQLATQAEEK